MSRRRTWARAALAAGALATVTSGAVAANVALLDWAADADDRAGRLTPVVAGPAPATPPPAPPATPVAPPAPSPPSPAPPPPDDDGGDHSDDEDDD